MAMPMQDCIVLFVSYFQRACVLKADEQGDSITNRQDVPGTLQTLMCEAYRRHLDVLNRGFGGYNTTMYVLQLSDLPIVSMGTLSEVDKLTGSARTLFDKIFAPKSATDAPQVRLVTIWFGESPDLADSHDQVQMTRFCLARTANNTSTSTRIAPTSNSFSNLSHPPLLPMALPMLLCPSS